MAAAKGNQYAAKERIWCAAINEALERRGGSQGRMGALRPLAEKLLGLCEEGDLMALKELGDRLDGKPTVAVSAPDGGPVQAIITWAQPST